MTKPPQVTAARFVRAIKRDGWYLVRKADGHHHYGHPTKRGIVTVAMHPKPIPTGTLREMIKDAGLTIDELKALL